MVELGQKLDSVASLHLHCVGLLGDGGLSTLAERLRGLDEISTGVLLAKRSSAIKKPTLITSSPSSILFEDFVGGTSTSKGSSSRLMDSDYFVPSVIRKSRKRSAK
jgi:hypothetical protein